MSVRHGGWLLTGFVVFLIWIPSEKNFARHCVTHHPRMLAELVCPLKHKAVRVGNFRDRKEIVFLKDRPPFGQKGQHRVKRGGIQNWMKCQQWPIMVENDWQNQQILTETTQIANNSVKIEQLPNKIEPDPGTGTILQKMFFLPKFCNNNHK